MLARFDFVRFGWLGVFLGAFALVGGCGQNGSAECADVSGVWRHTVSCSELPNPTNETWDQSDCRIVRHSASGQELGTGSIDSNTGTISLTVNDGIVCRGSVKTDRVEVTCPGYPGQTCGPDSCCIVRWQR